MKERRVVITGLGVVTAGGIGREALWNRVLGGRSPVRRVTRFDPAPFRSQLAAEIDGFDACDYMDGRTARRLDRFSQLGVASAGLALRDAGLRPETLPCGRVGVSIGSALGGLSYAEEQHNQFRDEGIRGVGTMLALAVFGGASGANIAIQYSLRGPNLSSSSSCASGAMAIGEAMRAIRHCEADAMLAGGVEAPLAPLIFGAFSVIKAMSSRNDRPEQACSPFDCARDGFVMAEGAAVLVLEERESAERRGAEIYAEILGYGQSNDGYHMTAPRPDGSDAARAICSALQDAELPPSAVGYVNAHATGTPLGDVAEGRAINRALGSHGRRVPVSGTKALYGHSLGASGAVETALTALTIHCEFLPGTGNLDTADEDCSVNIIPPAGRAEAVEWALTTSFGFGGSNAALVLGRYEQA